MDSSLQPGKHCFVIPYRIVRNYGLNAGAQKAGLSTGSLCAFAPVNGFFAQRKFHDIRIKKLIADNAERDERSCTSEIDERAKNSAFRYPS